MISLQRVGEIFKTIIRFCSLVALVFDLDRQDYLLSVKPHHVKRGTDGRTRYIPQAEGSQDPTKGGGVCLGQHDANIANVGPGWSGSDYVTERHKERIGIATIEKLFRVQSDRARALHRCVIDDRSRRRAVAVDAICAGAQSDGG